MRTAGLEAASSSGGLVRWCCDWSVSPASTPTTVPYQLHSTLSTLHPPTSPLTLKPTHIHHQSHPIDRPSLLLHLPIHHSQNHQAVAREQLWFGHPSSAAAACSPPTMSGTGYQFAYGAPPSDLSYPEFPGRVGSIPSNNRIPSLPMPMMPMMPVSGAPPPLPPQRLPSIPQSMTLPSISRVPSIPTATRPYSMGGMGGVDPVLVPSVGWPAAAFAPGWPLPTHVSSTWPGGEQPMYGQSVGYVMPAPGWSVGPPLHLYGQSPSTSVADAMDGQAQQQSAEMEMAGAMSGSHTTHRDSTDSHAHSSMSGSAANAAADPKSASGYNVRVSPPPHNHNIGSTYTPSYLYEHASSLLPPSISSAPSSTALDPAVFHHNIRCLSESTPRLCCLPTIDHSEQVLFVSHCQYTQIVKRREQRRNDKRRRIKSKHKSRQAHAARRVRGTGGRFLTKEEKAALAMQQQLQQQMQQQAGSTIKPPASHPFAVPSMATSVNGRK